MHIIDTLLHVTCKSLQHLFKKINLCESVMEQGSMFVCI